MVLFLKLKNLLHILVCGVCVDHFESHLKGRTYTSYGSKTTYDQYMIGRGCCTIFVDLSVVNLDCFCDLKPSVWCGSRVQNKTRF